MTLEKLGSIDKKVQCLIVENAPNGELFDSIAEERFSEPLARYPAKQMTNGLGHIHKHNIAHRDIKPQNVVLGEKFQAKLIDLGLSALVKYNQDMYDYVGTKEYAAPEIHMGGPYQGKQVDIFSLGVSFFNMVVGKNPFQ